MIFVINSGSSSLKFTMFTADLKEIATGIVERIGLAKPFLSYEAGKRKEKRTFTKVADHAAALMCVFAALKDSGVDTKDVTIVGHRVVHGGEEFTGPTRITAAVLKRLRKYSALAPLHNPPNIEGIESCTRLLPRAVNIAVFDTSFYRTIPDHAYVYSLPYEMYAKHGIRKYGFHGISHEYVAGEAVVRLKKKPSQVNLVTCHLGSGASVTAVKKGKAIDTSMGFTPLEGLTMSTRTGDMDPAIVTYLMKTFRMTPDQVDAIMNSLSGLLGISGEKDLRDVLSIAGVRAPGIPARGKVTKERRYRARLAVDIFCYDVARYIGQYAAIMGGADAIVFTAGIGERSEYIRKKVMRMVTLPGKPKVLVIPTREEYMIAKQAKKLAGKRRR
jgi:acetate kinase